MNDAYDTRLKKWRLEQLRTRHGFVFHQLDIANPVAVMKLGTEAGPFDTVVNLAARAGVRYSVEDPWIYCEANITGTLNLLELCGKLGVKKLVSASSSSVYGVPEERGKPFREDQPTDHPLSPYAASKKAAEAMCYAYHHLYGLDISLLRYFTVYGPAGRPDMSPFRFIKWIAEGEPLVLFGDGGQVRDFTFIDDIARGTVFAMKPVGYEIFNLGNDRPVSIRRLIELIEELLGKEAQIDQQPPHPADVRATWASIDKARGLLGWEPSVPLEEGLKRTVDWYLTNRGWAKNIRT